MHINLCDPWCESFYKLCEPKVSLILGMDSYTKSCEPEVPSTKLYEPEVPCTNYVNLKF